MESKRYTITEPVFGMVIPDISVRTHDASQCKGEFCALHNPSDHPLKHAPITIRADKDYMVERQCDHGVGHPDPDSVAYFISIDQRYEWMNIHGCCAQECCVVKEEQT